jgi:hypothetical protein
MALHDRDGPGEDLFGERVVLEVAGEVHLVTLEIEESVAAETEQDDLLLASLSRAFSASSMTAATAWLVSGAMMSPSVRANFTAAS